MVPLKFAAAFQTLSFSRRRRYGEVLDEYGDGVHFVEIDIEADQEIAQAAGVAGTPCVQVFKDKERVEVLNGVKMKSVYRDVIDGVVGRGVGVEVTKEVKKEEVNA